MSKSLSKNELAIKIIQLELKIDDYRKWLTEESENHYSEFGAIGGMIENEVYKRNLKKFVEIFGEPEQEDTASLANQETKEANP